MLRKEIRDILIQNLWFAAAVLILPALMVPFVEQAYPEIFFPVLQFGLLFWAFFLGNFLFFLERGQGGLEYVFSLPYSRLRLVGLKILPRAVAAVLLYAVHIALYLNGGANICAFRLDVFTFAYLTLFVIGFSLSAVSDNFVVSAFSTILAAFVFEAVALAGLTAGILLRGLPLHEYFEYGLYQTWTNALFAVPVLILLAAFPLAFLQSVRRLDIRPAAGFNRKFLKRLGVWLLPGFLLITFGSFQGIRDLVNTYYMTQNHQLIESRLGRVRIFDGESIHKLESIYFIWSFRHCIETGSRLIVDALQGPGFENEAVVSIDLSNRKVRTLYQVSPEGYIHQFWKSERDLLLIETKGRIGNRDLVRVDIDGGGVRRIPLRHPAFGRDARRKSYYAPQLIGTDVLEGRRFWLLASEHPWDFPLLQIFEDGTVKELGTHSQRPRYFHHYLLVPEKDRIEVFRLGGADPESVAVIAGFFQPLDNTLRDFDLSMKKIPGSLEDGRLGVLDLEALTLNPIGEFGLLNTPIGQDFFLGRKTDRGIACFHWREGSLRELKEIPADFDEKKHAPLFGYGLAVREGSRIRIYGLPDLEELRFKGLRFRD